MYWFGSLKENNFKWQEDTFWDSKSQKVRTFSQVKLETIIDLLDRFGKTSFNEALPKLVEESGFSEEETKSTLALLPNLLSRESLEKRLRSEFNRIEVLDKFTKLPSSQAKIKAIPQGVVLHVTAGNVFLSSIDSLIMGFLTKNISILKVSSQNQFFPLFFAEKLSQFDQEKILSDKFSILHWKGGDTQVEDFIKNKVNTIMAWGGEEMISSYKKNLGTHVKFLEFGPKVSLQVISQKGLENKNLFKVAQAVVQDIIPWDQSACASPQDLYLEEGINESEFLSAIDLAFKKAPSRGRLSEDEAIEILKEKYRAYYSELMNGGQVIEGKDYLLHLEENKVLRPSPLHRSLIIKRFKNLDELTNLLEPFSYYLQSCAYLLAPEEKEPYLSLLSLAGIKRFAPLGTITFGMDGSPHDGRFVLRELVNFIPDELRAQEYGEELGVTNNSNTVKSAFESTIHPKGYLFSSGGTTGEPKFLHFSYEEFDYMSDMLAENFRVHGLKAGMTVANLFVAGNLWSSFLCVEKALEKIGVIQLPIGGLCSEENILFYLKKFMPDAVMGIPSLLLKNAEYFVSQNEEIKIPMVFYAGEALSEIRREFLATHWKTSTFASAGYASVDAGVIGYQCRACGPNEHHLFSDLIQMTIVEEEALVTSIIRDSLPIKNYHTGDKVEWISDCSCGRKDKRFKLLGRIDTVIQIWSCRMLLNDVEASLSELGVKTFQLEINEIREANVVKEKITLFYESLYEIETEIFLVDLYKRSRDVKDTIAFADFKKDIILNRVKEISRNERTGKISLILDKRR